jgi:hypothetical protein
LEKLREPDLTPAHLLRDFVAGRNRAFIDVGLLLYRPPLLDILPIYIIFLLIMPVVLILAGRLSWRYVLTGSFLLWLFAQFGFRTFVHEVLTRFFGLNIPLNEMGAFDLWAWQFWWVVGVSFGVHWAVQLGFCQQRPRRSERAVVAQRLMRDVAESDPGSKPPPPTRQSSAIFSRLTR